MRRANTSSFYTTELKAAQVQKDSSSIVMECYLDIVSSAIDEKQYSMSDIRS